MKSIVQNWACRQLKSREVLPCSQGQALSRHQELRNEQPWYSTAREQKTAGVWGWLFKKIIHTLCQLKYFTNVLVECLEDSSFLSSTPWPHPGKASSQRYWRDVLLNLGTGYRNIFINETSDSLLGSLGLCQSCDNPMPKLYIGKTGLYLSKGENGNWVIPNFSGTVIRIF